MERRKYVWLSGLVIGGLVGCAHTAADKSGSADKSQPGPVAAVSNSSDSSASNSQSPESQKVDAKPSSLVQIADVQAQVSKDPARSRQDRQNALDLAKTNYQRALKLDANCLAAYLGLARVCSDAGEHQMAIQTLDLALAKHAREAQLWYERGIVMGRQKQYDEAAGNLNQALQIEPKNSAYGKTLGLMLARAGRGDEGAAALQHWMSEADAHYNVAKILERMGQSAESQRHLQLALRADPNHQASLAMYQAGAVN